MDGHGGPWNSKALAEPVEAVGTAEDRGVPRGTAERRGGRGSLNCQSVSSVSQSVCLFRKKSAICLEVR